MTIQKFVVGVGMVDLEGDELAEALARNNPPLPGLKAAKLAALAEWRWRAEIGGAALDEATRIATDRDSQIKIKVAYDDAKADANHVIPNWKLAPGVFITLTAPELIAIGDTVRAHVQGCFDNEAALSALIEAAEDAAALDAIDIGSGWPS